MLQKLYDWMVDKAAHPHAERWLFFFSFVESSFFPIPPHPLLGLMCLARPDRAIRYGIICTLASVLGGLFGYAIGYFAYQTTRGQRPYRSSCLRLPQGSFTCRCSTFSGRAS